MWESENLTDWTEQRLVQAGIPSMGCVWAPDVIRDPESGEYIVHYSASEASDDYREKGIWYVRTRDFVNYSKPEILYKKEGCDIIDSAMYEEDGRYYLFLKRAKTRGTCRIALLSSASVTGPFEEVPGFDKSMDQIEDGLYEAPTAVRLDDGKWCLFLDFYGARGAGQGYVPFLADSLAGGKFVRSDGDFSFPYGFKHGTILTITDEEYERVKAHDWSDRGYGHIG